MILLGIWAAILSVSNVGAVEVELSDDGGSLKPGYIYVEPVPALHFRDGERVLQPYRERRGSWGATLAIGYNSFEPLRYQPNFATTSFGSIYRSAEMPLLTLSVEVKKNFAIGSFAVGLSAGTYRNSSDVDKTIVDSTLTYQPVKFGATFYADTLDDDPIFVPYIAGGMYTMYYNEGQGDDSFGGHTSYAPWANLGLDISLNWVDQKSANSGFDSCGLQNTALFVELQKFVASPNADDPDFSNDVSFAAGLRMEF